MNFIKDLYYENSPILQRKFIRDTFTESMRNIVKNNPELYAYYTIDGISLAEAPNTSIREKIKHFLLALTFENMSRYSKCDEYRYFYNGDFNTESQLKFLWNHRGGLGAEQWFQIQRLFEQAGFEILLIHADFLWSVCSNQFDTSWKLHVSDDIAWINILTTVMLSKEVYESLTLIEAEYDDDDVRDLMAELKHTSTKELVLDAKIKNALYRGGIMTLSDLIESDSNKLLKIRCIGKQSLNATNVAFNNYLTEKFNISKEKIRIKLGLSDK